MGSGKARLDEAGNAPREGWTPIPCSLGHREEVNLAPMGCLVLGFLVWPLTARYLRAQTLQLKEQPFVEAARANGTGHLKIILRHILPNMGGLIIVVTTLNLAGNVGADAILSFLGLGVQPPGSGLGLMIAQYLGYLQVYGYEMIWPVLAIIV